MGVRVNFKRLTVATIAIAVLSACGQGGEGSPMQAAAQTYLDTHVECIGSQAISPADKPQPYGPNSYRTPDRLIPNMRLWVKTGLVTTKPATDGTLHGTAFVPSETGKTVLIDNGSDNGMRACFATVENLDLDTPQKVEYEPGLVSVKFTAELKPAAWVTDDLKKSLQPMWGNDVGFLGDGRIGPADSKDLPISGPVHGSLRMRQDARGTWIVTAMGD